MWVWVAVSWLKCLLLIVGSAGSKCRNSRPQDKVAMMTGNFSGLHNSTWSTDTATAKKPCRKADNCLPRLSFLARWPVHSHTLIVLRLVHMQRATIHERRLATAWQGRQDLPTESVCGIEVQIISCLLSILWRRSFANNIWNEYWPKIAVISYSSIQAMGCAKKLAACNLLKDVCKTYQK